MQEAFVGLLAAVLHQCIRPLVGACGAPGHHGYQRAYVLISRQTSSGPFGSPDFASAVKTDPPSRLILSQTSAGIGCGVTSSLSSLSVQFLCSCPLGPLLRPGLQLLRGAARRGCQGWPLSAVTAHGTACRSTAVVGRGQCRHAGKQWLAESGTRCAQSPARSDVS